MPRCGRCDSYFNSDDALERHTDKCVAIHVDVPRQTYTISTNERQLRKVLQYTANPGNQLTHGKK